MQYAVLDVYIANILYPMKIIVTIIKSLLYWIKIMYIRLIVVEEIVYSYGPPKARLMWQNARI